MIDIKKDPFRLFFPLGCLFGFLGNLIWPLYAITPGFFGFKPMVHSELMIGGFLSAFVVGFLMTAVPRFTKTNYAGYFEILPAALFLFLSQVFAFTQKNQLVFFFVFLTYATLLFFAQNRFRQRKSNPPSTFIFVGVGLLMFLSSSLILSFGLNLQPNSVSFLRTLFFQGGVLSLVLGIGGRLIPGILGWTEIVEAQRAVYEQPKPFLKVIPSFVLIILFFFVLSFPIEHFTSEILGRIFRASAVSAIAIFYWRLHRLPKEKSILTFFIWFSSWFVLSGSWLFAVAPSMHTHGLHLIFVGGFSLMTFMVATRVTLAHGGGEKSIEQKSKLLLTVGLLVSLATLIRVFIHFASSDYTTNIAIAASIWLTALLLWSYFFIPRMLKANH